MGDLCPLRAVLSSQTSLSPGLENEEETSVGQGLQGATYRGNLETDVKSTEPAF